MNFRLIFAATTAFGLAGCVYDTANPYAACDAPAQACFADCGQTQTDEARGYCVRACEAEIDSCEARVTNQLQASSTYYNNYSAFGSVSYGYPYYGYHYPYWRGYQSYSPWIVGPRYYGRPGHRHRGRRGHDRDHRSDGSGGGAHSPAVRNNRPDYDHPRGDYPQYRSGPRPGPRKGVTPSPQRRLQAPPASPSTAPASQPPASPPPAANPAPPPKAQPSRATPRKRAPTPKRPNRHRQEP